MKKGVLPGDLTTCLVFHSGGVSQLSNRIKELQQEKAHQIRKFKELKKSHIHLIKGKKGMQEKLVQLEEKCHSMMLLKFGREVDLKKLENISTNRIAEELKETIAKKDVKYSRKMNEWDVQINQAKQRLLTSTRDHTSRLDTLNELTKDMQNLEGVLDGKQKNLGGSTRDNVKLISRRGRDCCSLCSCKPKKSMHSRMRLVSSPGKTATFSLPLRQQCHLCHPLGGALRRLHLSGTGVCILLLGIMAPLSNKI